MTAGNIDSFRFARASTYDFGVITRDNLNTTYDIIACLDGETLGWNRNLAASHGSTKLRGARSALSCSCATPTT